MTTNAYDNAGDLLSVTDPLGHAWSREYDELQRARKLTDPLTHFTTTVWWGDGRVKETKDARGFKTQTSYDFVNKKITTTEAVGTPKQRVSEQTIDAVGNVVSVKDPLNHVTGFQVNSLDQVTKVTDPLLHDTTLTRDNLGNVTKVTDALLKDTSLTYDALERQVKVTDPLGQTEQTVLDAVDQGVGAIDGLNKVDQEVFDSAGRNTLDLDAANGLVEQQFAANDQAQGLTDPVSNRTVYVTNELGAVTKEIDPLGKTTVYVYDDAARLTSITDRLGRVREFSYLNNNLLQTENWRNTAGGPIVWTRSFTFNENDQVLTATDNNGTYTWTYDELNRVATQVDPWNITLTYTRDAADRLTGLTDSKGGSYTFTFDNADRITSRQFTGNGAQARLDYIYNDRNEVTELKRYSDTAGTQFIGNTVYTYDDAGRLTNIANNDSLGAAIDVFGYTFDAADRLTQETATLGPTRNYTYDAVDQVTSDGTNNYSFDLNGNRTMAGYQTGAGNRLTSDGTWNYAYDDEGNLATKTNIVSGQLWTSFYDHNNHLTKVERKPSAPSAVDLRVEFKYDVLGNRIQKSVDADGDGPGAATIQKFAYAGADAWGDLDNAGALVTRRLYLDAVDQLFARVGSGGSVDWYFTDHLNSVRDVWNPTGGVLDHLDYDAFGKITAETNPAQGDRYVFTGRERDTEINLRYYRDRYYDQDIGRFTSADRSGFAAGDANLYRYVSNHPTNATDPSGRYDMAAVHRNPALGMMLGLRHSTFRPYGMWAAEAVGILEQGLSMADVIAQIGPPPQMPTGASAAWYTRTWNATTQTWTYVWNNPTDALNYAGQGLQEGVVNIGNFILELPEFSRGLAAGIGQGIVDTVAGLWNVIWHPLDTFNNLSDFIAQFIIWISDGDVQAVLQAISAELYELATNWESLTSYRRGYLLGKLIGQSVASAAGAAAFAALTQRFWNALSARCRNSFIPGTLVLMGDGTAKPIEEIQVGDLVWAEDPVSGEKGARQVEALIVGRGEKHLVDVDIDGHKITATYNHPFWDAGCCGWVFAEDIRPGFKVETAGGYTLDVDAVQDYTIPDGTVYNFTVADLHTYFVLAGDQPVLVHNCPGGSHRPGPGGFDPAPPHMPGEMGPPSAPALTPDLPIYVPVPPPPKPTWPFPGSDPLPPWGASG